MGCQAGDQDRLQYLVRDLSWQDLPLTSPTSTTRSRSATLGPHPSSSLSPTSSSLTEPSGYDFAISAII
ncbi:hypothetical protein QJS04_geneDACA016648 [Acorus gramineus]|uniref:Uncharacterized protein n=1 Tax=Acorus gramineus TaxID=55184 RepID=A0AAV9ASI9_ACOGR|nr:hypothetical protein QJS04_geneDACA016648 [Acorus gramineus]